MLTDSVPYEDVSTEVVLAACVLTDDVRIQLKMYFMKIYPDKTYLPYWPHMYILKKSGDLFESLRLYACVFQEVYQQDLCLNTGVVGPGT